ncbi:MAG: ABC transporter ATP-binding protein [Planctomycetota bacterium]
MIRATELRKSFGDLAAVDGLTMDVRRGETLGLLGPNGAGKTTTIHMLVGVLRPDAGEVIVDGSHHATDPDARRRIGVAPQSLSLYEDLSAAENLRFFASLYGMSGASLRERTAWCLDFAGLTERAGDRVATFSGGMKRRLNIAVALVHEPDVLLLDEPTVGVDPQSRNHIFEAIETLKAHGLTMLYTTHYMEEAQRLCDRVAIVDRGKLLDVECVETLIERHGGTSIIEAKLLETSVADELPGTLIDDVLRIETDRPLEDIAELSRKGVSFTSLSVKRPDLEAVFLALTGRSLRDD